MATQSSNGFPTEIDWSETDLTIKGLTTSNVTTENIDTTTINNVPRYNIIEGDNVTFKWNASNYIGVTTLTDPEYSINWGSVIDRTITPGDSAIVSYAGTFKLRVSSGGTACLILKNDDGSYELLGSLAQIEPLAQISNLECIGRLSCIRITYLGDRSIALGRMDGEDPSYLIEKLIAGDITKLAPY